MSQAVEAVGRMLQAFPNARDGLRDGYIGVMAQLLTRYPRMVALRCAHPIDGVIRECKFLPTVAEAIRWLEREQMPMRNADAWERRSRDQLADRERFDRDDKEEPLEHRQAVAARIKAEFRAKGFKFEGDCKAIDPLAAREHLKNAHHVTDEHLDQIPNQPASNDYWQGIRWPT